MGCPANGPVVCGDDGVDDHTAASEWGWVVLVVMVVGAVVDVGSLISALNERPGEVAAVMGAIGAEVVAAG